MPRKSLCDYISESLKAGVKLTALAAMFLAPKVAAQIDDEGDSLIATINSEGANVTQINPVPMIAAELVLFPAIFIFAACGLRYCYNDAPQGSDEERAPFANTVGEAPQPPEGV